MKIFGCLNIALVFFVVNAKAQEDDLRLVITKTFYETRLYEKIFFEYEGKEGITFSDGYKKGMRGAFIVPDTTLQKRIPNILHLVGTSHGTEKNFMTMTLISHPLGNIYVTSHIMDPAILLWVNFDRIVITKRNAKLIFYTTSLEERESLKGRYISAECDLIKKRSGWKIRNLKIVPADFVDIFQ